MKNLLNKKEIPSSTDYTIVALQEDGKIVVKATKVTIIFKDNEGNVISFKVYRQGETVIIPEAPTKEGLTFIGWGDVTIDVATSNMTYIAQYEVTPKVTLTLDSDTYTDVSSIALNATKTETVTGIISFTTDLSNDVAEITDNVLTFKKHYEGSVTVTANALDVHSNIQSDSKTITVSCDGTDTVTCTISDINTPEVGADATSATVTYKCNVTTTTHAGVPTTVTSNKEEVVIFDANESEEARNVEGSFTCEHGETVSYIVKQEGKIEPSPDGKTYKMVDLGLPSGLKWASCNIGATKPEEYGLYFQWGATVGYPLDSQEAKDNSYWTTCPYQTQDTTDSSRTKFTKYVGSTSSSYKDSRATDEDALKTVLDPEDDAAHVNMGGNWRMPTSGEFQELNSGTTVIWTTENGVYGRKFTSKTDSSKYIFIPLAGSVFSGSFNFQGSYGYVWSSSLHSSTPYYAYYLLFYSSSVYPAYNNLRFYGLSVRGVC